MIYVSGPRISRFMVEVVSTPEDMARGLGFRKSLNQRQGMLFVFPDYSRQSMWMKNMNFPLIVFLNGQWYRIHLQFHQIILLQYLPQ